MSFMRANYIASFQYRRMILKPFFSLPNMTAGFVGVLVGFTSSVAIVFQAATTAGATPAEISSWIFALGISLAMTCICLSYYYKMPILTGWSTPGAALLVTCLSGMNISEATGAFMIASSLTIIAGITGFFQKVMEYIPKSLTSAMLAGILLHFGMNVFTSMQTSPSLVMCLLFTYIMGKKFFPRYCIVTILVVGILIAKLQGLFHLSNFHFEIAKPVFTNPSFSWKILFSAGIPLFIVTMTSQNVPGIAILNAAGYKPAISPTITFIGLVTLLFAPFGCYSICLAAITGAICSGKEADNDPSLRYKATIFAGLCWLTIGLLGATVVAVFFAFPKELILSVAGMALFTTIASSLKTSLDDETQKEPAIITLLICASGMNLLGIGSAFWGLLAGVITSILLNWNRSTKISTYAKL